jgi:hypothetical protein
LSDDDPTLRFDKPPRTDDALTYVIELLSADGGVERILAMAHSATLARAVFQACGEEYPGRLIILRDAQHELARREP